MKLAICTPHPDSLDGEMQSCHTEVAQTLANLEALERRVGVAEGVLVHARLREVRVDLQKTNEEYLLFGGIGRQQLSSYKNWIQRW